MWAALTLCKIDCPVQRTFQPESFRPPFGDVEGEEVLVMALLEEEEEINILCLKNLVCKSAMMK